MGLVIKDSMTLHRLIHGEECCYGNSGISFSEGYNFYRCACGKWREAFKKSGDVVLEHYNHVLASQPPNDPDQRTAKEDVR